MGRRINGHRPHFQIIGPSRQSSFSYLQSVPIKGNERLPSAVIISQEDKLAVYVESGGLGDGDRWDRYTVGILCVEFCNFMRGRPA